MPDLLIELFSEEIPARMQRRAAQDLKTRMTDALVVAGLTYASAGAFSTPRRLVLTVEGLSAASPTRREERKGPRADAPEAAIAGFERATNMTRDTFERRETPKGVVFFAQIEHPGRPAAEIVAAALETTIRDFPWPKSMRWGNGTLRWVRPLHAILCLLVDEHGAAVVPLEIDGLVAGNTTRGHRFMAPAPFTVTGFDDYRAKLARAKVVLDPEERANIIAAEATNMAFARDLELVEDAGLLAEVSGLVEWPVVLAGPIEEDFLGLPPEVLQTSMREHQKFFSLRNPRTARIEGFVTVANIEAPDGGETILKGNRKVLSARLSDARFFWENDLARVKAEGLEGMGAGLANVTFHNKLGSQKARIDRIEALAREIAPRVGAQPDLAAEAARVVKSDLQSEMVGEFPELQGIMGGYYARAAGLPEAVAEACKGHYSPLGPGDAVPDAPVTVAVALADKIDTLTGFWAIDEKPTGSKDPFALRRAALGVIRLVLVNKLRLPLLEMFEKANSGADAGDLLSFFHDRLKVFLRDEGIRHDVIDAVLGMPGADDLTLVVKRAEALAAFLKTDDGENLIQGFKRANNILTQAEARDGVEYSYGADPKFAESDAERTLFAALDRAEAAIAPAMTAEDFAAAMAAMAELRGPIDAFFTEVQINTDNAVVRRNRLNLLHRIRAACLAVADLGRIEG
ncbi:glycine--tRNA ligase subunit beta [Phaeovulum vinaykumarii]|uniref:Glycine--tRNA ligase beta subunit n=1 Tax=Phaeovulum vinaykumarii TaxID=407234 RepID=A0A1N7JJM0_9RHOB|nr:glycine--tRNA ligase subunit beta [Phaeovulum vinaykumarii]SIS49500.1 glycyl-tRNA synthetase beta chain [Phaeovulum vinaykumarii]SOB89732.1 glycyl-tRNA synthetase beta chain [Phaeovulum vinaykumarii]